ncbi:MAG: wax ester/triacylglycerol synthase family O-acyltransferase [Acidimicrobiales bacterium]
MAGIDAKFLYSETATAHMHTLKVAVVTTRDSPGWFGFTQVMSVLGQQMGTLPPLRRRAVPVPFSLGHPVWIEDPDFDLANHVSSRTAPAPGGDHQLAAVVADIAGTPLRRDRPLWELVVVEGLADGRGAVIAKLHHAVADGGAAVALLQSVVQGVEAQLSSPPGGFGTPTPDPGGRDPGHSDPGHPDPGRRDPGRRDPGHPDPWRPEPVPSRRRLLTMAMRQHRDRLHGLPRLVGRSYRGLRASEARRRSLPVRPPLPLQAPRTSLNVSLTGERTFAMTRLALADLKSVRRAHGTTLNDVYLAVCAGALRGYLLERGELPPRPLVASVPVATDTDLARMSGNRVDNLYVSIGTDIADPIERLRHIHEVASAAKDVRSALGSELLEQRAAVVPPQLYRASVRAWTRTHLANRVRPPLNVVLSNVAGPRDPISFGPVRLQAIYSVGPILEGIGCNMTAWSYVDGLYVSVLGCPVSLPDPWQLVDRLHGALTELVTLSG